MNAPCILVADDEPLLRAELSEALARLWPEARIVEAQDGIEALRLGRETAPQVAFLDIRMPAWTAWNWRACSARAPTSCS